MAKTLIELDRISRVEREKLLAKFNKRLILEKTISKMGVSVNA